MNKPKAAINVGYSFQTYLLQSVDISAYKQQLGYLTTFEYDTQIYKNILSTQN